MMTATSPGQPDVVMPETMEFFSIPSTPSLPVVSARSSEESTTGDQVPPQSNERHTDGEVEVVV